MKAKTLIIVAAVAMLATGCRDIRRQGNDLLVYPTTAGEVAATAKDYHSDAALVVTKADTQYVLYRRACAFSQRDGIERCYAMRYVSQHRCRHDFSARGGEFRLDEPEQPVVLTRNGDNALVLTVDSIAIAVTDIVVTDSMVTCRFGIDTADREATLYLYGKARDTKDIFAETSIQQMLSLSLTMDDLMADWEEVVDTGFVEADESLEAAELELDAAMATLDSAVSNISIPEFHAEYSHLDSLASALGFTEKKSVADGNGHLKYTVSGGKGGSKACYARMEAMHDAAAGMHRRCTVEHRQGHRKCRFSVEW
jgi:hypothetical protein